jgi:hypothetical protein
MIMVNMQDQRVHLNQNTVLSAEEAETRIRQMEVEHDILRREADGWCAWPVPRLEVSSVSAKIPMATRCHWSVSEGLAFGPKDIRGLISLRQARYVVRTVSSGLAEQEGNWFKDVFDDLLREIGDYFKIEAINKSAFIPKRKFEILPFATPLTCSTSSHNGNVIPSPTRSADSILSQRLWRI